MSQNVYDKLGDIKEATDKIRDMVAKDLKESGVLCSTIEELPDKVMEAINNNLQYYVAWIFTTDPDAQPPVIDNLWIDTSDGTVINLPPGWTQRGPLNPAEPSPQTYDLRRSNSEPETTVDQEVWMSYATFNSKGAMTSMFSPKMRMTGTKGDPGVDGLNGTIFEEIYLLGNTTIPDTPYSDQTKGYLPFDSTYNRPWTRYPQGVTNDMPVEYYSKREYNDVDGVWGEWNPPVQWSQFGRIGRDGKGVEYIFCNTNGNMPTKPESELVPDDNTFNGWPVKVNANGTVYEWWDDPQTLKPTQTCWCSIRRQEDAQNNNGVYYYKWGPYSDPTVWARYSVDGQEGGGRTIQAYCVVDEGVTPKAPIGGSWDPLTNKATAPRDESGIIMWDLNPPSRDRGQVLWMSTCSFHSSGYAIDKWSPPVRMTVDGISGKDGDSIQFIYRLLPSMDDLKALQKFHVIARENGRELVSDQNSDEAPYKIDIFEDPSYFNSWNIDPYDWENINGIYTISDTNWTDEPSGIDLSNLVECVCTRSKGSDGLWSKWSDPVPWSVWGEDGVDGEGVEYIYTVTPKTMIIEGEEWDVLEYYRDCRAKKEIPEFLRIPTKEEYKNWSTDEKDYYSKFLDYEFIPGITDDNVGQLEQEWYDEPQDVDADQPYEWVAIRKKQIDTKDGNPNEYVGEWQDFSIPKLWNKFATDGRSSVMAYAFTRSNDALNTLLKPFEGRDLRPKGGTFNDPTPDPSYYIDGGVEKKIIWYDSIPDGTSSDDVWMTSKFFSSISDSNNDGETVDNYWSIPCKMTDRSDFQVEFASYYENPETKEIDENVWPNPNDFNTYYNEASDPNRLENAERAWRQAESEKGWNWGDENTAKNTVYMATCRLKNQKWTNWHVVKVKGETGKAGTSVSIIGTAYLETEGACDNVGLLNNTQSRILSNGRAAIYVLHYCENTDKGIMYKWLDPEDPENPENVNDAGYYTYSDRYKLHTGDGWLINGELWVWDGDSYENVGQIQGPAGEADHLYIAFSDEDGVLEKNSDIKIDLTLKVGKYIGYCAGPKLSNDALIKSSTYNWSRWKGQDGWGQEQVFLLTKENPGYDNSYQLTRDHGPAVPSDSTEKHDWRPVVDSTVKEWVSPLHVITEPTEDYAIGDVRWSDIPLTPSEEYPFCWVATRSTSNWKWKGENGFATLYSNYVTSGVDAIYLELSEDSVSVPLDMSGNIDADNDEQVMFDLTATLYSGRDKIANYEGAELVKYYYRLNEESEYINNNTSGQSPLFQIKKFELENKPSKIYIKVEWKGGFWEKECKINYGTSLYEITVSKSVLHKDLSTGYLFENYDTVDVYVKRWVNGAWLPASDTFVYSDIKMLDETSYTKSIITDSNGNASFTGLSKIKDISNIEFYSRDRNNNQICNETIGIVANGKDGAWQEFIYKLYENEVAKWGDLGAEWKNPSDNTTNSAGQKYKDPDYVPDGWSDDPLEVDYDNKYQYVSVRKRIGGSWGPFSTPTLWSRMNVNLQVHMSPESVIVYNNHENIGLNPNRIVTINLAITENGNLISPIKTNDKYDITLGSQTKGEERTDVWQLDSVTLLEDKTFEIKVKYVGDNIVATGTVYNLDFPIVLKQAVLHATHSIRLTQGGGENAIHLELSEDNAVYFIEPLVDPRDRKFTDITTTAWLYDGESKLENVTWNIDTNNCEAIGQDIVDNGYNITFNNISIDEDDIWVKITGTKDNKSASKTFRIRVTNTPDIWKLTFNKPVINPITDPEVKVGVTLNGTKLNALNGNKIKYKIGSSEYTHTGNLPYSVNLSSDRDEVVFELLDENDNILDTEGIGAVYDGKSASYFTISANYESCILKDGEEKNIYPIVRHVTDENDTGEIWSLNDESKTSNFYRDYNYHVYYSTNGNSYKKYETGYAGTLTTEDCDKYIFCLKKKSDSSMNYDDCPRFEMLITRVKDGEKGESGKTPVIYPAGKYDSNTMYNGNATSAPYVYTVDGEGSPSAYYIAYGNGRGIEPSANQNDNPDWNNVPTTLQWVPMTQYEAIYSDIGILKTALVGQWVFYKEWMFSQQGKNSDGESMSYSSVNQWNNWQSEFTPNILFNAKTGAGSFGAGAITLGDGSDNTTVGGWEITGNGLVATNSGKEIAKLGNDGSGFLGNFVDSGETYKAFSWDGESEAKIGNSIKITPDGFIASDNLDNPQSYFKLGKVTFSDNSTSEYLTFRGSDDSGFRTASCDRSGLAVYGPGSFDYSQNKCHDHALTVIAGTENKAILASGNVTITRGNESSVELTVQGDITCQNLTQDSDERLKNFSTDIIVDLDELAKLRKQYFTWKDSKDSSQHIGVSAQEIQKLYPEIVKEKEDGYLSVAYDKLSVIALKAIDVLHQDNLKLKAEIEELKKLIAR